MPRKQSISTKELAITLEKYLRTANPHLLSEEARPRVLLSMLRFPTDLDRTASEGQQIAKKYGPKSPDRLAKLLDALMELYPTAPTIDIMIGSGDQQVINEASRETDGDEEFERKIRDYDSTVTREYLYDLLRYGLEREFSIKISDTEWQTLSAEETAARIITAEDGTLTIKWKGRNIRFMMWQATKEIIYSTSDHTCAKDTAMLRRIIDSIPEEDKIAMLGGAKIMTYGEHNDFINGFYNTVREHRQKIITELSKEDTLAFIKTCEDYLLNEVATVARTLEQGPLFYFGKITTAFQETSRFLGAKTLFGSAAGAAAGADIISDDASTSWFDYSNIFKFAKILKTQRDATRAREIYAAKVREAEARRARAIETLEHLPRPTSDTRPVAVPAPSEALREEPPPASSQGTSPEAEAIAALYPKTEISHRDEISATPPPADVAAAGVTGAGSGDGSDDALSDSAVIREHRAAVRKRHDDTTIGRRYSDPKVTDIPSLLERADAFGSLPHPTQKEEIIRLHQEYLLLRMRATVAKREREIATEEHHGKSYEDIVGTLDGLMIQYLTRYLEHDPEDDLSRKSLEKLEKTIHAAEAPKPAPAPRFSYCSII